MFVAGELETAEKTDSHNQHLAWLRGLELGWLLGRLPLGYWHGQLDLLFFFISLHWLMMTVSSPGDFPSPVTLSKAGWRSNDNGSFVFGKGRCAPGLVHDTAPWITRGICSPWKTKRLLYGTVQRATGRTELLPEGEIRLKHNLTQKGGDKPKKEGAVSTQTVIQPDSTSALLMLCQTTRGS